MPFDSDECKRYSRHFVLPAIGPIGQGKLKSSKILVIGAGGLGSSVIMYLAAAGVGTLGIADYDIVEESNLNRQVIHSKIGVNKARSAADFVARLNPHVNVIAIENKMTAQNISSQIEDYDFVLDCTDGFETKFLINDACVLNKKPYCHGGAAGAEGQIMTYLPNYPCLRCLMNEIPSDAPTCAEIGVLGATVGLIGCMQATEAIKFITGSGDLITGRFIKYDGLGARFQTIRFGRDKNCPVCGENARITSLADENYKQKCEMRL